LGIGAAARSSSPPGKGGCHLIYGDFVAVGVALVVALGVGLGGALQGAFPASPKVDAAGGMLPVMTTR
jgi:hypothetical protein